MSRSGSDRKVRGFGVRSRVCHKGHSADVVSRIEQLVPLDVLIGVKGQAFKHIYDDLTLSVQTRTTD